MAKLDFKNINFHDCELENLEILNNNNKLLLYFKMDTHLFPGKKFGILKILKFSKISDFIRQWMDLDLNLIQHIEFKDKGYKKVVEILFQLKEDTIYRIEYSGISFERVDKYDISTNNENSLKQFLEQNS